MKVERIENEDEIREFLAPNPLLSAYQLGDLDPKYAPYCTWYGRRDESGLSHVLLVYTGLSVPALLLLGPEEGAEELLREVRSFLPRNCFVQILPEHEEAVHRVLGQGELRRMVRMGLPRRNFKPLEDGGLVESITHADTAALMALFRYYPDHFFEPYQLESGLYFGIWDSGTLVSAAGVHVVSERFDVVALGNIVTHPDFRSRGLAMSCSSALLERAFESVSLAALNTQESNLPALRSFEKVGFKAHHVFLEGAIELD